MARLSTFDSELKREGLAGTNRFLLFDPDVVPDITAWTRTATDAPVLSEGVVGSRLFLRSLTEGAATSEALIGAIPKIRVATDAPKTAVLSGPLLDDVSNSYANIAGIGDNTGGTIGIGQSYISNGGTLDQCGFILYRGGICTGFAYAHICTAVFDGVGGGWIPQTALATSDPYNVTAIGPSGDVRYFTFSGANQIELTAGTRYVALLTYSSGGFGSDQLLYFYSVDGSGHSGNMAEFPVGYGNWIARGYDAFFQVYVRQLQSDTATVSISPGRVTADALTASVSPARLLAFLKATSDALSTLESAKVNVPQFRTTAEATSIAQSVARILTALRSATDHPVTAESIARLLSLSRIVTDHPLTNESVAALKIKLGAASDSLTAAMSVARILSALRTGAESPLVSMLIATIFSRLRTTIDSLSSSELATRQIIKLAITRDTIDALSISELARRILWASRNGTDSLVTVDTVQKIVFSGRTLADSLSVSDLSVRGLGSGRSALDLLTSTDSALLDLLIARSTSDFLATAEELHNPFQLRFVLDALNVFDVATWNEAAFILKILVAYEAMKELKIVNAPDDPVGIRIIV